MIDLEDPRIKNLNLIKAGVSISFAYKSTDMMLLFLSKDNAYIVPNSQHNYNFHAILQTNKSL